MIQCKWENTTTHAEAINQGLGESEIQNTSTIIIITKMSTKSSMAGYKKGY
jgi:hypothetical protein